MSWLVEILIFIVLIPCDVVSYILGRSLIKKRVKSKYNVIISKFKKNLEIERYVHNHYDLSFNLHYIFISLWHLVLC